MNRNIKICHLSSAHDRTDTRIFYKECLTTQNSGYNVTLIIADGKGNDVISGITIIDVGKEKSRFQRFFKTNGKIRKAARELDSSVYHFHDPDLIWTGFLLSFRARVVYDIHENYRTSIRLKKYIPFPLNHILAHVFGFWERVMTIRCTRLIAEKYYRERFPEAVMVLNYPLSNPFQNMKPVNYAGINSTEIPGDNIHLLYTGSLSYYRGALHYARLLRNNPRIRISCVGEVPPLLYEAMKQQAGNDHFIMKGVGYHVPYEEIIGSYQKRPWTAGLAIFPMARHYYRKELTKFFEYMYFGIPIICSDFPVWRNIVEVNNCGICVDPENIGQQLEAVNLLFENIELRTEMGRNGKQTIFEKYNWDIEGRKLIDLYQSLIS